MERKQCVKLVTFQVEKLTRKKTCTNEALHMEKRGVLQKKGFFSFSPGNVANLKNVCQPLFYSCPSYLLLGGFQVSEMAQSGGKKEDGFKNFTIHC